MGGEPSLVNNSIAYHTLFDSFTQITFVEGRQASMQEHPFLSVGPVPVFLPRSVALSPLVAVLIDGDNIQLAEAQLVKVLQKAESMGEVVVRRVYGNWTTTDKSAWKEIVLKYAFTPCHHIHGMPGKNATDIALTIGAMDLFSIGITIFFLVSSDSDFTPLIQRLRASNCQVIGVGSPTKNASLIPSCNQFMLLTPTNQKQLEVTTKQTSDTTTRKKKTPAKQAAAAKKTSAMQAATTKKTATKKETTQTSTTKKAVVSTLPSLPSTKGFKPLNITELTHEIEQAFAVVVAQQGKRSVLLVDVAKALKERCPLLRAKDYGKKSLLFLVKARTDLFTFQEIEQDGKLLDKMTRCDANNL